MIETAGSYKSLLHQMTQSTSTCPWNDSCSLQELADATEHGAVGATCNPVIVVEVLRKEMPLWRERILQLVASMPTATEHDIAWQRSAVSCRQSAVGKIRDHAVWLIADNW